MPIYTCQHIFLDGALASNAYIEVESGRIKSVGPLKNLKGTGDLIDLGEGVLAPGFVDIQVNGGADLLFNDAPTQSAIQTVSQTFRELGTTTIFPTLITDKMDIIARMAKAVAESLETNRSGICGVHFEGPFLNPERKGVHQPQYMNAVETEFLEILDRFHLGSVLVTLAPETVSSEFIAGLCHRNVRVSAGHTNASYEEICQAADNGLNGFTHLFNAMPPFLSRAPGVVGAAFQLAGTYSSVIADSHHIHPAALAPALQILGSERAMLISDAMPCVGSLKDHFHLYRERISVQNGKCVTDDGVLAGSAISIADAVRYCVQTLNLPLTDVLKMSAATPAAFMGLKHVGSLKPGMAADLIRLDQNLNVTLVNSTFEQS